MIDFFVCCICFVFLDVDVVEKVLLCVVVFFGVEFNWSYIRRRRELVVG